MRPGSPREAPLDVSGFEDVLALAFAEDRVHTQPPWSRVVDEGIVEGLRHLMAPRRNVGEAEGEEAWRDPTRIVQHIKARQISVLRNSWLEIVGVVADDAAVINIAAREQNRVVEQEGGKILGRDIPGQFGGPNWGAVIEGIAWRKKKATEHVSVNCFGHLISRPPGKVWV